jgi:flagellar biosynthesis/type III secretory pathway M-ring protein FliF/YscJ
MTDILVLVENSWPIILLFIGLIIIYFIIREIRVMYTRTTEAKVDLEKEKINLMRTDMEQKSRPFFRVSPEKLQEIKVVDDENAILETDIFARHTEVEKRIERLENKVQVAKLDRMVEKIKREEERIG